MFPFLFLLLFTPVCDAAVNGVETAVVVSVNGVEVAIVSLVDAGMESVLKNC